jgi:hypothetical protein
MSLWLSTVVAGKRRPPTVQLVLTPRHGPRFSCEDGSGEVSLEPYPYSRTSICMDISDSLKFRPFLRLRRLARRRHNSCVHPRLGKLEMSCMARTTRSGPTITFSELPGVPKPLLVASSYTRAARWLLNPKLDIYASTRPRSLQRAKQLPGFATAAGCSHTNASSSAEGEA